MNNLLLGREYQVNGTWYAPKRFLLDNFKSVIDVELVDTTSSAGDWTGLIFQKIGKKIYSIPFSQENQYPLPDYFAIHTSDGYTSVTESDLKNIKEELIKDFVERYYGIT